jgi:hypothetical protein
MPFSFLTSSVSERGEEITAGPPVVVASHPRSGTHLFIDLLRRHLPCCDAWKWPGERLDRLYLSIDELGARRNRLDEATARRIVRRCERPLVKTHAWPGYTETFLEPHHDGLPECWQQWLSQEATVLYVYRDGRDVLASYQLMRARMDAEAETIDLGDFIRQSDPKAPRNRVARWARHVREWRSHPDVMTVSFEQIFSDPKQIIQKVADKMEVEPLFNRPLLPERFSSIWESRWARLFRVRPESTAVLGTGSQEWRQALSQNDRSFFHKEAGDLLLDLGYVSSEAWISSKEQ